MSTRQITVRLPVERVEALQQQAKAEHRSLAQQIEHRLTIADRVPAPLHPSASSAEPNDPKRFPSSQHIMTEEERNEALRHQLERIQRK
jgi:hypothetical protein